MHTEARKTDLWAVIPGFLESSGIRFRKAPRGMPDSALPLCYTQKSISKALLILSPPLWGVLQLFFPHKTIARTLSHHSVSFPKHLNFLKCHIYVLKIYTIQQHQKEIGCTEHHHQQEIPKTSDQQILEEMPVCLPEHWETDFFSFSFFFF